MYKSLPRDDAQGNLFSSSFYPPPLLLFKEAQRTFKGQGTDPSSRGKSAQTEQNLVSLSEDDFGREVFHIYLKIL